VSCNLSRPVLNKKRSLTAVTSLMVCVKCQVLHSGF
jgi:hypothetical protein